MRRQRRFGGAAGVSSRERMQHVWHCHCMPCFLSRRDSALPRPTSTDLPCRDLPDGTGRRPCSGWARELGSQAGCLAGAGGCLEEGGGRRELRLAGPEHERAWRVQRDAEEGSGRGRSRPAGSEVESFPPSLASTA